MKIDGHCHCGQIRFEAEVDPATLSICHCSDCQRLTGSAFRANIQAPAAHFTLTGTPQSYIKKTAESGRHRRHTFCGNCGTPMFACDIENPQSYSLRVGTITQRTDLTPLRQIWCRSSLPWVDDLASVPRQEKQ
jgi:hypothetical protein